MASTMKELLNKLLDKQTLTIEEHISVFTNILEGACEAEHIAAILAAYRMAGESEDVLYAAAKVMRSQALKPSSKIDGKVLADNCGTGGDGSSSFNISTAAAVVASSLDCKIAKHGNRSVSSKCGSADLLFACGYPDDLSPDQSAEVLSETGFTFFFAPHFHPGMKHVMPVRKKLAVRTVFNLLGPLANPISPGFQVLGVSAQKYIKPVAEALFKFGVTKAMVVHSRDGMDEISPCDVTDYITVDVSGLKEGTLDAKEFGFNASTEGLKGGDASVNKKIFEKFLEGEKSVVQDAVCVNAGALLYVCGIVPTIHDGLKECVKAVETGKTRSHFEKIISLAGSV